MQRVIFAVISCVRQGVADTSRPSSTVRGMFTERLGFSSSAGNELWNLSCGLVRTCVGGSSVEWLCRI
jgi:hypothetical protein